MKKLLFIQIILFLSSISLLLAADKKVVIAGAGPSTKIVGVFFEAFSQQGPAKNLTFIIPPKSVKHAGGIKASGKNLFGRTGRPLNKKELARNKKDIVLGKLPLAFIVGSGANVEKITFPQLKNIFAGKITNWKEVGGSDNKIFLVGREKGEAVLSVLSKKYPVFGKAKYKKRFKKDHQVMSFLKNRQSKYAIAFGVESNFVKSRLLEIDGFADGINVGLVIDLKNKDDKLVRAVIQFAESKEWKELSIKNGFLPVEKAY